MPTTSSDKDPKRVKTPAKSRKTAPQKAARPAAKASKAAKGSTPYTKPELREKIKKAVTAGEKGGKAGQWSARKAQLVAHEYEAEGGSYRGGRRETQKHLEQWTEEKWRTQDGKPARRNGTMKRYLPDEAWNQLTPEERTRTEEKKARGTRKGKQFVANSSKAVGARRTAEASASSKKAASSARKSTAKAPLTKERAKKPVAAQKNSGYSTAAPKKAARKGG